MEKGEFEKLVTEALEGLPRQFQEKLDNVVVLVEDWPTFRQLRKLGLPPGMTLFGLYEGVPKTRRGAGYLMVPPDRITIFQKPIEFFSQSPEAIKNRVRQTVVHEIGHHFGLSEEELERK